MDKKTFLTIGVTTVLAAGLTLTVDNSLPPTRIPNGDLKSYEKYDRVDDSTCQQVYTTVSVRDFDIPAMTTELADIETKLTMTKEGPLKDHYTNRKADIINVMNGCGGAGVGDATGFVETLPVEAVVK